MGPGRMSRRQQQYLQRDSLSRWATLARGLLHSKHIETPKAESVSIPPVSSILGVQLGMQPRKVTNTLGKPERIVRCSTADGSDAEIYWYYSLGFSCVISDGRSRALIFSSNPNRNALRLLPKLPRHLNWPEYQSERQ